MPGCRARSRAATFISARRSTWPVSRAGSSRRGARLVGGCCGTTPEHIKAIKAAVRSLSPQRSRVAVGVLHRPGRTLEPIPVEKRSRLSEKLARHEFPILVEVVPPKGCDATKEIEGARFLQAKGVDAINIPDGTGVTGRMSPLTLAALLQQQAGIEVLLHYSARNRNVLGIQADALGAHALGLRNILALTRDTAQVSTFLEPAVFEVDSIGLVSILNNLNQGLDVGGNPLSKQTGFLIGVELNSCAVNPEEELRRFELKLKAGANFALTQPVFDVEQLAGFLQRVESVAGRIPVIAGIWPLTSYRNAEFMNNEMPGISVPAAVMERMRRADTGDRGRAEGVKLRRRRCWRSATWSRESRSLLPSADTPWRWRSHRCWGNAQQPREPSAASTRLPASAMTTDR